MYLFVSFLYLSCAVVVPHQPVFASHVIFAAEAAKGRELLSAALDLETKGSKAGWKDATAKEQACDAYLLAAQVLTARIIRFVLHWRA